MTPPRIDAHRHYWSIDHSDYGWLRPTPQLAAIYKNFAPADLHPLLDAAAIDATVLVQAAPSEAETWRLLDLAALPDSRVAGVVGWCDLLAPDVDERVRRLATQPLLKGLRPMLQDIDDARWILQPTLQPAFAAMRRHGLAFDALVKGAAQLDTLVEFAQQQAELPIVLDHAGKPPIADGRLQHWITAIRRIARTTSVHCKLSGLITEAGADWSLDRLRPCVDLLLSEFGPQRLILGSD